jgi:hypothetical protein
VVGVSTGFVGGAVFICTMEDMIYADLKKHTVLPL